MNSNQHALIAAAVRAGLCLFAVTALTSRAMANPQFPGAAQTKPIALVGATLHPVSGPVIENGTLLFDNGKIVALGKNIKLPEGCRRLELPGKHVYPGLFDAYTNLGLVEINAVRATVDGSEIGRINPNVRAQVAVNPDSELIPTTRSNGVLLALTAPSGGVISGQSAVIQLDGWNHEDMTLLAPAAMHIRWPGFAPTNDLFAHTTRTDQTKDRNEGMELLKKALADAKAYRTARDGAATRGKEIPRDVRWEALLPVLDGKVPVIATADELPQIQSAVALAAAEKWKLIIYGGYDAPLCAELLKKHNVPVIVAGTYRIPRRRDDDYDAGYSLPAKLKQAGIPFCISAAERFGASGVRNLPYHAAAAAAFGLPADDALRAVTLSPAEILGVADRVGSLEKGKDATLIVTNGDPLETATQVEAAWVQGRPVDLGDRHKRLNEKYGERLKRSGL